MAWKPDYVTLVEAKDYLHIDDTADDVVLALDITAASRAADGSCRRQFGKVDSSVTRLYEAIWDRHQCRHVVEIDDLMSATGLTVTVDGTATTAYRLEPVNAPADGMPWTQVVFTGAPFPLPHQHRHYGVSMATDQWGWAAVPGPVKLATLMQMNRYASRRNSPYGIAGSPEQGSELRLLAKLDPDVLSILGSQYVRW